MFRPRFFVILGVATLAVAAGVVAPLLLHAGLALNAIAFLLLGLDWFLARRIRIHADRRWPPLLAQGTPSQLLVTVLSSRGRLTRLQLREELCSAIAILPTRLSLVLEPRKASKWHIDLVPSIRGDHQTGALVARVEGPLGIAAHQRVLIEPETVSVYPRIRWGGKLGVLLAQAARHQIGANEIGKQGLGGDFYALRHHVASDGLRPIHWRASARHQRLLTRETTHQSGAHVLILLDRSRTMLGHEREFSKLDYSLAACLALARVASGRGDRVTLLPFADRPDAPVPFGNHSQQWSKAFGRLYGITASRVEPNFDVLAERALRVAQPGATTVLMTSITDLTTTDLLRRAVSQLNRRHQLLVINLEDADLRKLASARPDESVEVFAQVAALGIQLQNRALGVTMSRSGVRMVSCSADTLAMGTVSAYLEAAAGIPAQRARATVTASA